MIKKRIDSLENRKYNQILMPFIWLLGVFIILSACKAPMTDQPTRIMNTMTSNDQAEDLVNNSGAEFVDPYQILRDKMVTLQIESRGIKDPAVLHSMRNVPRHEFVLDRYLDFAYEDTPLPIHYGQTISQPYMVALMTELLQVEAGDRVLEIGTGSGYQAAILGEMGVEVFSVEIIPELADEASRRLKDLEYDQIKILNADGYFGWEEYSPYKAIIVTAAPDHLPQPLIGQLMEAGRLVIPIGPVGAVQTLWLFEKFEGDLKATNMGAVTFVPLTGEH